jgi:hypothetical protein
LFNEQLRGTVDVITQHFRNAILHPITYKHALL